jgi:excinuclease UvrABC nuclease subunit
MFKLIKEIKSKSGELHFRRWSILSSKWFSIYFHGIYKEDLDKHLHSHPWNILTIVLYGSYVESLLVENNIIQNTRNLFNIAYRPYNKYHKICELLSPKVYTIAFVFGKRKTWGYNVDNKFIENNKYRNKK